ncbi:MAG: flagellar biosynthetic protein FliO [Treponema sp.]|nr:flagellar biosynthetic protein FliO [Treponema sp.]
MGGEKLYTYRNAVRIAAAAYLFLMFLFGASFAFTQTEEIRPVTETAASEREEAERAIVLGDVPPGQAPGRAASAGLVIRMILVLVVVALAVYGVMFFIKKAPKSSPQADPNLKILSTAGLGAGHFVHVISVGEKAWLVGSADTGVNLIAEITDQNAISAMLLERGRRNAEGPGRLDFKTLLLRMGIQGPRPPGADNVRRRRERLRGL